MRTATRHLARSARSALRKTPKMCAGSTPANVDRSRVFGQGVFPNDKESS